MKVSTVVAQNVANRTYQVGREPPVVGATEARQPPLPPGLLAELRACVGHEAIPSYLEVQVSLLGKRKEEAGTRAARLNKLEGAWATSNELFVAN